MFDVAEFIFSAKKNSKYPSLKNFLQPSCLFVKIYDPFRFFTFHPFSRAFIINVNFCIDLSDIFTDIGGIYIGKLSDLYTTYSNSI